MICWFDMCACFTSIVVIETQYFRLFNSINYYYVRQEIILLKSNNSAPNKLRFMLIAVNINSQIYLNKHIINAIIVCVSSYAPIVDINFNCFAFSTSS